MGGWAPNILSERRAVGQGIDHDEAALHQRGVVPKHSADP
jgi:hypothetical protein